MTAPRPHLDRRPRTPLLCAAILFGCALTGCQSSSAEQVKREAVREAIQAEDYREAVSLAAELHEGAPDDEELSALHRTVTVAFYLDKGRTATLAGEDDEALELFARAREVAPESELVYEWQVKTNNKLADKWLAVGNESFASEDFTGAAEAYKKVLEYVPRHPSAITGLGQVTLLINYRNGLGEGYYKEGIRALSDYRLRSARRGFTATTKYLPEQERARRRASEVDRLLAGQRVEVARGFEAEGLYAGALNEFRFAQVLDRENPDVIEGMERLEREAKAAEHLRDARMLIYRRRFDEALAQLDAGVALTAVQQDAFQEARESITGERHEALYQEALVLEHDGDFLAAIEAYVILLETVDYYKDARARQSTLEGYLEMAEGYYEKAEAAADDKARLQHLRSIEGFWPDFKTPDGREIGVLIDLLEGKLEAAGQ